VPYACTLEDLLTILYESAPATADAVALQCRWVEHGLLSVGLKIHCVGAGSRFASLVERLGGAPGVLWMNVYRHARASLCLVLPPVGNARAAILLLECLERFTESALFSDQKIQIQVCSPGRLNARRSALLAIGFYLGSDTLRRYSCGDLETTVSNGGRYQRGQRLVIYDAGGNFDRGFEWWERSINGKDRLVRRPELPFKKNSRTDLLAGSASRLDIENINLLASLLVHVEHHGYWKKLGERFEEDMQSLLHRHLLLGLVNAPWVVVDESGSAGDSEFFSALQELVVYAFDESVRVSGKPRRLFSRRDKGQALSRGGILYEMQALLKKYRTEIARQSCLLEKGGYT
jgi:hypothetical protein